ncbi:glutathione S-transferase [Photobacterium aphoticum]|uniref:GST N-terminal domain-containing protein n=1 Tax=Photobacterium aphoticum TaxID=754436 RepID=A0A0J1GMC1_9GAMM|nr:glutathione S-transferase [Photobacterium aphoticum]KLV00893.1 hypothetical protein ABT58_10085 [Photobacterium aphoticum]PSU58938.1 glutathione S-transferase [Photobacterium aphoticum]
MPNTLPILYSLRRCPYCIRARIALLFARQPVILREVKLKNKPPAMLEISTKGTVPIVVLPSGDIIEESLDIMRWALAQNDPDDLLIRAGQSQTSDALHDTLSLIAECDNRFIPALEAFKHSARYHTASEEADRMACLPFIEYLESRLIASPYLMGERPTLADFALLPFIRQFSRVDKPWYRDMAWHHIQQWLTNLYAHPVYGAAMRVYPVWQEGDEPCMFQ